MEQGIKELIKTNEETKELTQQDIDLLVAANVLPKDIPKEMVTFFMAFCKQTNLNPFKRQVYIIPRFSKMQGKYTYTIQTGIDGYRAIADRTKKCAGIDDPIFEEKDGKIISAKSVVYKFVNETKCSFTATAYWNEYYPTDEKNRFMWDNKPRIMLGKCAEALALRKAFPNELSGTYTDEEMQQQADVIDIGREESKQDTAKETNGKPAPTGNPFKQSLGKCARCGKDITSHAVLIKSTERFGNPLCFPNCQNDEEKERKKEKETDAEFSVSEESFNETGEVI